MLRDRTARDHLRDYIPLKQGLRRYYSTFLILIVTSETIFH